MSPEPSLDATGIARRQFASVRKGYDAAEVRAYLHEIADLVGRLQRGEAHERERAERAESRAELAERLDEHRLVELLGEETARVLDAARDAAGNIRTKAEESAARMIRDAQTEARSLTDRAEEDAAHRRSELLAEVDGLRREAEAEVERRRVEGRIVADDMRREAEEERDRMIAEGERVRGEAESSAEQIRASAREQGRRLVGEAQAVRERMLGDLSRRRRIAREQLERLNGARERLLAAYEVVRRTVDEATTELTVALPEARAASEQAMRRVHDEPEDSVEVIEAELSVARMSGLVDDAASSAVSDDELDAMLRELAEEEAAQAARATGAGDGAAVTGLPPEAVGDEGDAGSPPDDTATGDGVPTDDTATGDGVPTDDTATDVTSGDGPATGPATARPMTDGEKWGIRLPRQRRSAGGSAAPGGGSRPASAPARAGALPGAEDAAVAAKVVVDAPDRAGAPVASSGEPAGDEGETGPYVDELFARIRSERTDDPGPGGAPEVDPTAGRASAASGTSGAVAVAEKRDGPAAGAAALADPGAAGPAATEPAATSGRAAEDAHVVEVDDEPEDEPADEEPADPVVRALTGRDEALAPVDRELGRRLKRVLADEQNEVLDALRRGGTVDFVDVVPPADEHTDRYAIAAVAGLDAAAAHGAASGGGEKAASCDEMAATLAVLLVEPLRTRIERSFDDADGDLEEVTERLRGLYREWKANHIGNAVRHFTAAAYARGAYDATGEGEALRWLVDDSCHACPDCDDNALAGPLDRGTTFPTGHVTAPAHPDCRCLVVPAASLG